MSFNFDTQIALARGGFPLYMCSLPVCPILSMLMGSVSTSSYVQLSTARQGMAVMCDATSILEMQNRPAAFAGMRRHVGEMEAINVADQTRDLEGVCVVLAKSGVKKNGSMTEVFMLITKCPFVIVRDPGFMDLMKTGCPML